MLSMMTRWWIGLIDCGVESQVREWWNGSWISDLIQKKQERSLARL